MPIDSASESIRYRPPNRLAMVTHVTRCQPDGEQRRITHVSPDPRPFASGSACRPSEGAEPTLTVLPTREPPTAVVLVLHGGRARSAEPTSVRQLAYRRMLPIARAVHRAVCDPATGRGAAVCVLRNRLRGWNEPTLDALHDARWALDRLRACHPDAGIVVVGHSLGGRVALRVAGGEGVLAVCALAPWLEPAEPVDQLAGRAVLIAHGDRDRWTDPNLSFAYAVRARQVNPRVARFSVPGAGHWLLRRSADWTGLVSAFVAGVVGAAPQHPLLTAAFDAPTPEGLRLPLPAGLR